ncbi:uncharacterized protein TRIVIDRAFT_69923 [Trichoderma virens Gv29-8]|uniref:Uncharacterized protein n=1 Tax=Hypocrea virens (strain Gv29-8 / FGSC 10586) TaxID=413071 RepID=G9N4N9_HYPVG|nr:uncharacterized protein TRIVIDRAFT_69923 [Trichoderma virens Gv29-8]EHK18563.1 hypothetical protein TRIVIDRAFT_69923 [Trichoderma virens Gv29-8]UKZ52769.1 hypothetical protein TrVGV298_006556 [Trichoderma virens]
MARGQGPTGRMAIGLDGTREQLESHPPSVDSSDSWRMESSCQLFDALSDTEQGPKTQPCRAQAASGRHIRVIRGGGSIMHQVLQAVPYKRHAASQQPEQLPLWSNVR